MYVVFSTHRIQFYFLYLIMYYRLNGLRQILYEYETLFISENIQENQLMPRKLVKTIKQNKNHLNSTDTKLDQSTCHSVTSAFMASS